MTTVKRRGPVVLCGALVALLAPVVPCRAAPGDVVWTETIATAASDVCHALATDGDGNVYVAGVTYGGLAVAASKGDADAFLLKLDPDGTVLWRRQPGTSEYDEALGVATDTSGNVYVVGQTDGKIAGPPKGDDDAFVIKYDRDGTILWRRQPGSPAEDLAWAVATDGAGNVYVVGGTEGSAAGPNKGGLDPFIVKYDPDGAILWRRQPGGPTDDEATGVATDADGNVVMVGVVDGPVTGEGNSDAFVVKFDANGAILWRRRPPTPEFDAALAVATAPDRAIYVVGQTEGRLGGPNKGGDDAFVIKYDRDGTIQWRRQPGTAGEDLAWAVATDADGNVSIAGGTEGVLAGPHSGLLDPFVITYDGGGTKLWGRQLGTGLDDEATAIAGDGHGNIFVGGVTGSASDEYPAVAAADAFVTRLAGTTVEEAAR